ncbi:type 1 glutamine amidotransferase domain-containing protein [Rhodococcus sp. NPDC003382]
MTNDQLTFQTYTAPHYQPRRILMIVSNPAELKGFPVGFFAEELTRAYLLFIEAGHSVDIASPLGGNTQFDAHSDPRTPGTPYADDLISLGFINHPQFSAAIANTQPIKDVSVADYDAVWVAGGGAPLITFKDDAPLQSLVASFYESGKVTSLICHGSSLLLWARMSDGHLVSEGKRWTGFSAAEEEAANKAVGMILSDYTIEGEAAKIPGTHFICGAPDEAFAVRDGHLITGQQQYSTAITAQLVLETLEQRGDLALRPGLSS